MTYNAGDRIGDYQIVDVLGAGGMGRVYKVRNLISERVEAMKVLLPNLVSEPELADRFMREIKVQASLDHPNIAKLHTAQRIDNQLVMLMEYMEGETLEKILSRGPIDLRRGLDVIFQVLAALSYAHSRGVVHRDIKPANMMLMPNGQGKLMDFGIAHVAADRKLTQTGRTLGSLYYMSPEQINGAPLDARADLYSVGVSLYEVATGRRPFQGDSDYSIMAAHLSAAPIPPIQVDPRLPAGLSEVILMALAKDPAQRFQSAEAFGAALQSVARALAQQPIAAPPPEARPVPPPPATGAPPQRASRSRRGLYMALGSVATIAVLIVGATQAPRFFRSTGAASQEITPGPLTPQPAPPANPRVETPPQTPPEATQSGVQAPAQSASGHATPSQSAPTQSPVTHHAPAQPARGQSTGPVVRQQPSSVIEPVRRDNAVAQPPPRQAAQRPAENETVTGGIASQQSARPAAQTGDQGALREARDLLMLLGTRATSVKSTIDRMRQEQNRMGVGLRGDISTALRRMEFHLDEGEAAIRAGEISRAKSSLQSAERELEKLESFAGR